jgi:predicted neuraminidase
VHVASLEEAANGDLLYSFYAGTREKATDVATYMSRLSVGSKTWTEPRVIFDEPDQPDGNAAIRADDNATYLFFSTIRGMKD